MPQIPALRKFRLDVEVSLGCTVRPAQGSRERDEEKSSAIAMI